MPLLGGTALCAALVWSAPALAAGDPQKTPQASTGVGEVVVTAQRRSERLRDVPISISVFSGQQLAEARINRTVDLAKVTPGLIMGAQGTFTQPAIRGVTTNLVNVAADPNVATYVDGVYIPAGQSLTFSIPNLEQVEVLKGPQGTLFGRNATGGAILINTQNPSYTYGGDLTASYGRFNDATLKGYVSLPLVADKITLGLAGLGEHGDGWIKDVQTGADISPIRNALGRVKLRVDPTNNVRIVLSAYDSYSSDASGIYGIPLNGNTAAKLYNPAVTTPIIPTQPWTFSAAGLGLLQDVQHTQIYSGKVDWKLDVGTLSSLTAYYGSRTKVLLNEAVAGSPGVRGIGYDAHFRQVQISQEVDFTSTLHGPFNFSLGSYYSNGHGGYDPIGLITDTGYGPPFLLSFWGTQYIKAVAVFGEAYLDVTSQLHFIAGLRYSDERRRSDVDFTGYPSAPPPPSAFGQRAPLSWHNLTPRASVRYDLSRSANVYFSFSEGFKSGLVDIGDTDSVVPETVDAYEAGFKGRIGDRLDLNAAIFRYNYKNLQVQSLECLPVGDPHCQNLSVTTNAARARTQGLDLDMNASLAEGFAIRTGISVLDAKFVSFPNALILVPTPGLTGNLAVPENASGNRMIRAPRFTLSLQPTYSTPVEGGKLEVRATLYYSTRMYYDFGDRISQAPYATLDARVSWTPDAFPLTVSLYGSNLTNKAVISGTLINQVSDNIEFAPPRQYGVELSYKF